MLKTFIVINGISVILSGICFLIMLVIGMSGNAPAFLTALQCLIAAAVSYQYRKYLVELSEFRSKNIHDAIN